MCDVLAAAGLSKRNETGYVTPYLHDVWVAQGAADGCFHDRHLLPLLLTAHHRRQHNRLDSNNSALPQTLVHLRLAHGWHTVGGWCGWHGWRGDICAQSRHSAVRAQRSAAQPSMARRFQSPERYSLVGGSRSSLRAGHNVCHLLPTAWSMQLLPIQPPRFCKDHHHPPTLPYVPSPSSSRHWIVPASSLLML